MPVVSNLLLRSLESTAALSSQDLKQFKSSSSSAIVVLSGGRLAHSPEYGSIDTVSATSLQRLNYASWLNKKVKLPILLSGGSRFNEATSEAVLMNQFLLKGRWTL